MALKNIPREERRGLTMIYTGNGKGKTTAALGMALRAVAYNWRILFVQFIKGDWDYGEIHSIRRLEPNVDFYRMGRGFVRIQNDKKPIEEHEEAAKNALEFAFEEMQKGIYDLVILDEVNVAIHEKLVTIDDVLRVITHKPSYLHLLLTGRYAPESLFSHVDLVTEMKEIKHPFQEGIYAQPGIDY